MYQFYTNLNSDDHSLYHKRIIKLVDKIIPLLNGSGFAFHEPKDRDAIAIGFSKADRNMKGGFGIAYDNKIGSPTFSLQIIKTFDEKTRRFYKKEFVAKSLTLEEISKNLENLIKTTINRYDEIETEDLSDFVDQETY